MNLELVERIRSVQFTPVRLREGYEMATVDQCLDELEAAASRGLPLRTLVEAAGPFPTVTWREGYNISEVDDFLAALAAAPPEGDPTTAGPSTSYGQSFPVAATPVIEERPGLMARLFRRFR